MTMLNEHEEWIDGSRRKEISDALREAMEAMDQAYYHSQTDGDLVRNTNAVSAAMAKVRRHARANR